MGTSSMVRICACVCTVVLIGNLLAGDDAVNDSGKRPCGADKYTMCMFDAVATPKSGLDHVDALGYSGAAFRIQSLERQVCCPSTVSPSYGFIPPKLDHKPTVPTAALTRARTLARPGKYGEYVSGKSAYDLWIALLEADEASDLYKQQMKAHKDDVSLPVMNSYCLRGLRHAREAAGPFLRRRAAELQGKAASKMGEAAACYEQVAELLNTLGNAPWNPAARQTQATVLRQCADLETKAAALIGEALTPLDPE